MQILIVALIILILIAFIIYKNNNKFEKKEQKIYLIIIFLIILIFVSYDNTQEDKFPELFKKDYYLKNNLEIKKISSTLLNNLNITSKDKYIYKFTYLIEKNSQEYLCTTNEVIIKKLQDEFLINEYQENCKKQ